MNVAIGSVFRNSSAYLNRYFEQIHALSDDLRDLGHRLTPVLMEGDSIDGTAVGLRYLAGFYEFRDAVIGTREHGGPPFGSVDHPQRWAQMAYACNGVVEALPADADALIYVESDLLWEPRPLVNLLSWLEPGYVDAIAPLCLASDHQERFYDIWGYRKEGTHFQPWPPYHDGLAGAEMPVSLDSAGSCIVMCAEVARAARFQPQDCIVGFCRQMREHGYHLWLSPSDEVRHP